MCLPEIDMSPLLLGFLHRVNIHLLVGIIMKIIIIVLVHVYHVRVHIVLVRVNVVTHTQ